MLQESCDPSRQLPVHPWPSQGTETTHAVNHNPSTRVSPPPHHPSNHSPGVPLTLTPWLYISIKQKRRNRKKKKRKKKPIQTTSACLPRIPIRKELFALILNVFRIWSIYFQRMFCIYSVSVGLYCCSVIVFLLRIIAVKLLWVRLQLIIVSLQNLKALLQRSLLPT